MPDAEDASFSAALGGRLRALREARGLSLREAAETAGLSPSFVRLVERGESEIALRRLMRLVDVYSTTVAEVLAEIDADPPGPRTALDEASRIEADDGRVVIVYLRAPAGFGQPFRLLLKPAATTEELVHADPEFFHVVRGRPTLTLVGERFDLVPGDTIYVRAGVTHAWRNGKREATLVGVLLTGR